MDSIDALMKQGLADDVFPGGVLLVSVKGSIIFFNSYGYANIFSEKPMKRDIFFDLASLTKPLATTLAVMVLINRQKLSLETKIGSIIPDFNNTAKENITIKHLLCHTSGFCDYRPYYIDLFKLPLGERRAGLRKLLLNEVLINPIGKSVVYSDLGFMILCWVLESITKRRIDSFVEEEVYKPLGFNRGLWRELFFIDLFSSGCHLQKGFAATEFCPRRKMLLEGKVHDENAYVVGGIEGHSGLFGTAKAVNLLLGILLRAFHGIEYLNIFNRSLLQKFFIKQNGTERALGFDTPSSSGSSSGNYFSENSVGHLGFTGTSFWMDLDRFVIVLLFTNRIHPSSDNIKIRAFRPVLHDTVMKTIINGMNK